MSTSINELLDGTEPRTLAFALIGTVALILVAQAAYLVWPEYKRFDDARKSHQMLEQAGGEGSSLATELASMTDEVAGLSQRLHGDMAELPEKQMETYIIGRLQRVSWQTGVELISVRPGTGQQVQQFRETLFDVRIQARYHESVAWLRQIGRELGFIVVKRYQIRRHDQSLDDPVLDVSLTMVAYRMVKT